MSRRIRPIEITTEIEAKLDARTTIDQPNDCWGWAGTVSREGYATLSLKSTTWGAHRLSYTRHKGAIPEGLVIDHLCRNRTCTNPDHLEPVTDQVNTLRGTSAGAVAQRRDACKSGHLYSEFGRQYNNRRYCAACNAEHMKASRARRAA